MKIKVKHFGALIALFISIIVVSCSTVVLAADYIVCPPAYEFIPGGRTNSIPFRWAQSQRYQQLYEPSVLSGESGTVTNVYFRSPSGSWGALKEDFYDVEISLGNTPSTVISNSFLTNIARCYDWTLVYQAKVMPVRTSGKSIEWFPLGDVNDIFNLDGSNSVLLEIRFKSKSTPGRISGNVAVDYASDPGLNRLYSSSTDPNGFYATTGGYSSGYGAVTKFDLGAGGIPAEVRMEPQSLNLDSNGNYVSFKVTGFPEDPNYTPHDVDPTSMMVKGVGADLKYATFNDNKYIGKADRLLVEDAIGAPDAEVEVEVTGQLNDGTGFMGNAIIKAL